MTNQSNKPLRTQPGARSTPRPSPGVFFWVVGPMLLIVLGMFSSSPQCVLNPQLSCAQNWHTDGDGALTIWLINTLWLRCARLTLLAALSIVLSALIYHITLALRGITPITHFVFMGAMCAIFIPPTLFLMFSKFLNKNLMTEAAYPIALEDGHTYRLFKNGPKGNQTFLLTQEQSRAIVSVKVKVLGTVQQQNGRLPAQLAIFPAQLARNLITSNFDSSLYNVPQSRWLYALIAPHFVIFALDIESGHLTSGSALSALSPFLLLSKDDEISEQAQQLFLKSVYERQPEITPLWQEITNENHSSRVLLARMLPLLENQVSEARALGAKLKLLDQSEDVQTELSRFLPEEDLATEATHSNGRNILDADPSFLGLPE